jgi:hypothetical protein
MFGRDHQDSLICQLFHIKQTSTLQEYIDRFTELIDQLVAYENFTAHIYYTTRFVDGLETDIRTVILIRRPVDLDTSYSGSRYFLQSRVVVGGS